MTVSTSTKLSNPKKIAKKTGDNSKGSKSYKKNEKPNNKNIEISQSETTQTTETNLTPAALRNRNHKLVRERALRMKKKVLKTSQKVKKGKVRTSVTFRRPYTLRTERNPKYPRNLPPAVPKRDFYSVLKHPLNTEACMKLLEEQNTITFLVYQDANKNTIREAISKKYGLKIAKITTLNLPTGEKKAYIRLHKDADAIQFANSIGMI